MPPLSIMIKPVSSACNMRCRYCFYADVSESRESYSLGRMSLQTLENTVRRAAACAEGSVSLAFQGGEPTLAGLDFYRALIALEKKYGSNGLKFQNAIQTNGYDISDELLRFLVGEHFLIGVSVDGTAAIHDALRPDAAGRGSFARVEDTVDRLERLGAEFNILTVVSGPVAREGRSCFEALSKYGYLQFIPCIDPFDGRPSDYSLSPEAYGAFLKTTFDAYYAAFCRGRPVSVRNFDNYLGILMGLPPENCGQCGRCGQYFLIEADGGVYPCDFYVLDNWRIGNINDSSFFSLAKSPVGEEFRALSLLRRAECESCEWYGLCRGGCRRDREPFENGLPGLNRWCESYKALFEYAFHRMREMAEAIRRKNAR